MTRFTNNVIDCFENSSIGSTKTSAHRVLGLFFGSGFPNIRHQFLYVFARCWGSAADEKSDNKIGNHRNASKALWRYPKPPIGLGASPKPSKLKLKHIEQHQCYPHQHTTNRTFFIDAFGEYSK